MSLPKTQRGVTFVEEGKPAVVDASRPLPDFHPDSVIIKVKAVALNPTDWKHIKGGLKAPSSTGSDFAGDIVAVGKDAESSGFKVGDAVAGYTRGGKLDPKNGAFQEYIRALPGLIWRKPSSLPYEDAAAAGGIALSTAAQALYHRLKLPYPGKQTDQSKTILIWAGSTGVGMYAILLAKLSGLRVVTTASPKNHDLLRKLGADAVYDYKDPEAPAKIKEWSRGTIDVGFDTIAEHGSTKLAAEAFGDAGGELITLLPVDDKGLRSNVKAHMTLVYSALEKDSQDYKDMATWNKLLTELIEQGKLGKGSVPLKHWEGGLDGVVDALKYVQDGKVSAQKVVLTI